MLSNYKILYRGPFLMTCACYERNRALEGNPLACPFEPKHWILCVSPECCESYRRRPIKRIPRSVFPPLSVWLEKPLAPCWFPVVVAAAVCLSSLIFLELQTSQSNVSQANIARHYSRLQSLCSFGNVKRVALTTGMHLHLLNSSTSKLIVKTKLSFECLTRIEN